MIEILESEDREPQELVPTSLIADICAARDAALAKMEEASATISLGYTQSHEAEEMAKRAHFGAHYTLADQSERDEYRALFRGHYDSHGSLKCYRKDLDARVWTYILERVGVEQIMDKQAKTDLRRSLTGEAKDEDGKPVEVPEVTPENVLATVQQFMGDADLIFKRGIANVFSKLDRRFKSHDGFKLGSRMILTHVFDSWGMWNYGSHIRDTFMDIERVFAVLDGCKPRPGEMEVAIRASREGHGMAPRQSEVTTTYFKIVCYKNGNAHLWFQSKDLVTRVNKLLAEYYGELVPDGMAKDKSEADLFHRPGLPAKSLQFYPTPPPVVARMIDAADLPMEDARVLEPSAGEGNVAFVAEKKGAIVTAVEIDRERYQKIVDARVQRVLPICRNFLQMESVAEFDVVLMNPPFYGTHYMDHVMHAWEFLKPGGRLVAVLPATVEFGESKRHTAFRKWVDSHTNYWGMPYRDLPAESFASSGTRINTVILTMRK